MRAETEFHIIQEAKHAMYRVFFVGMIRDKHELILCGKAIKSA